MLQRCPCLNSVSGIISHWIISHIEAEERWAQAQPGDLCVCLSRHAKERESVIKAVEGHGAKYLGGVVDTFNEKFVYLYFTNVPATMHGTCSLPDTLGMVSLI